MTGSKTSRSRRRLQFEELEARTVPTGFVELSIGGVESFGYADGDGDEVLVRIRGASGTVRLAEQAGDGFGNDNGTLEDGEELGAVAISNASSDFQLEFVHDTALSTGAGRIALGRIDAIDQVIDEVFVTTNDPARSSFELQSFQGKGFTAGGGLQVGSIVGDEDGIGLILDRLDHATHIEVADNLAADTLIADDVAGAIDVGGWWTGDLSVGGGIASTGRIGVGQHMTGEVRVLGDLGGIVRIGARAYGKWTIVGTVTGSASMVAGDDFNRVHVTRDFFGQVVAGNRVWLDVGGSIGSAARINSTASGITVALVDGNFHGSLHAGRLVHLSVADTVSSLARSSSLDSLTLVVGRLVMRGAHLSAPSFGLHHVPSITAGAIIDRAPFVITQPGLYRFTGHLEHTGSGPAIEIAANDVVLDLQGFTLIGTAGPANPSIGIFAANRSNVVVRNGTITGFQFPVMLVGNQARDYLVEEIRAVRNWYFGIWVEGSRSIVRNSQILDTGGSTVASNYTVPIAVRAVGAGVAVRDNIISGRVRSSVDIEWVGVHVDRGPSAEVSGNLIAIDTGSPTPPSAGFTTFGLWVNGGTWGAAGATDVLIADNLLARLQIGAYLDGAPGGLGTFADNRLLFVLDFFRGGVDGGGNVGIQ